MDLKQIANSIPDYQVFLTIDEMYASTRQLTRDFPDRVTVKTVGQTRRGDPIELISITHGPDAPNAFVFGGPHPNEPIGCMMVEFLSRRLCEDATLRAELGFNWHFIKSIDSDGMRLNEGWFKGPFAPVINYHRDFYRPPAYEQVEWTFPIEYKTLKFNKPLPETQALMQAIDELKPKFMYSLHNSEFGGVYYYISKPAEPVFEAFAEIPGWFDLGLELGEPEMPYAVTFAPAIYRLPTVVDSYDYMEANGVPDPAAALNQGASSFEYAAKYDTFALVVEMPYWDDPRVIDLTLTDTLRREAIMKKLDVGEAYADWLQTHWDSVKDRLQLNTPFHRTLDEGLRLIKKMFIAERQWAQNAEETNRPASQAELFSNLIAARVYQQRGRAMLWRMLNTEIEAGNNDPAIIAARDAADAELEQESQHLESLLNYRVIPIRSLVGVQACAGLATAAYVRDL